MLFVIALTVVLVLAIYIWQWRSKIRSPFESFKGPPGLPLIGNTHQLLPKSSAEVFHWMVELEKEHGAIYKFDVINQIWLICCSADEVERIMTGVEFNCKGVDYDLLMEWLGTGLLISKGNKWFTHRKALTPAFHFKILENFVHVFENQSTILAKKFLAHGEEPIKIFSMVKLCTLDVIVETAMGTMSEAQTKQSFYTESVESISAIVYWRMFSVIFRSDFVFQLTKVYKPYKKDLKTLRDFTLSIIEKRRQASVHCSELELNDSAKENDEFGTKRKMALLDVLLQTTIDGKHLTDEEIREEVDNFMFAGHDTTASAVTFILYSLAKHPEVQQKVYDEILAVIGDSVDTPISLRILNELKYLELVIKETLRLFPPVPYISRNTLKEVTICGATVPANTKIAIGIYNMHRNPKYFPDPEKFLPERFEAERGVEKQNPYAYIPFSAGGRNCIGQKFAMYELKSTISKVLRYCRVELPYEGYEPPLKAEMILKPMDEMPLRFFPR